MTPLATKPLYDVATYVAHQITFNYTMIPFVLLSHQLGFAFWRANYFFGHIALVVAYVALTAAGGNARSASASASARNGTKPQPLVHRDTPHPSTKLSARSGDDGTGSPYNTRSKKQAPQ